MSTELLLLVVIGVYLVSAVVWGLAKHRNYLKTTPDEKVGKNTTCMMKEFC